MAGVHNLVISEEHSGNLPAYRHFRQCSCGWQCRTGSDVTADSQFVNHQLHHGFAEPTEEEKNEPKNTQELAAAQASSTSVSQEEKKENGGGGLRKLGQT